MRTWITFALVVGLALLTGCGGGGDGGDAINDVDLTGVWSLRVYVGDSTTGRSTITLVHSGSRISGTSSTGNSVSGSSVRRSDGDDDLQRVDFYIGPESDPGERSHYEGTVSNSDYMRGTVDWGGSSRSWEARRQGNNDGGDDTPDVTDVTGLWRGTKTAHYPTSGEYHTYDVDMYLTQDGVQVTSDGSPELRGVIQDSHLTLTSERYSLLGNGDVWVENYTFNYVDGVLRDGRGTRTELTTHYEVTYVFSPLTRND